MKISILPLALALSLTAFASNAALSVESAAAELKLTELAQTYSAERVLIVTGSDKANKFDALFIDMGVINQADLASPLAKMKKVNAFISDQKNLDENYLGFVADQSLVERIQKAWKNAKVIEDKDALAQLNAFIDKGYTTGYNLVRTDDKSGFNEDLMIRYGHSDIDHAIQLIYLMKREGFNPKVQLTPKTSAFVYLAEWGEPSYPVEKMASGKMVAMATEYNLDLEFKTKESKQKFMNLINQYAKKDAEDEKGLLIESWWQPFYRSYSKLEGYERLTETQVMINSYQADLMVLPENAKTQQQQVKQLAGEKSVKSNKVWVNPSFHRYMKGEHK